MSGACSSIWNNGIVGRNYDWYYDETAEFVLSVPAANCCKLPPEHYEGYKWPKLDYAYKKLCKSDPANISKGQDHRALSDALAASFVMLELIDSGYYRF